MAIKESAMKNQISGYGWVVVLCGFLTLLVTNGMTLSGLTVFDAALLNEFGWQRGALKLRDLITFAGAGLVAPLFGYYADKGYIKNSLLLGCGFLAAGCLVYAKVTSLAGVYLAHVFFGLSLASAGIVAVVYLVSSQVSQARRGLALGLALVGSSLGNTIFPQLNLALMKSFDWRSTFVALSMIPSALAVFLVIVMRRGGDNFLKNSEPSMSTLGQKSLAEGGLASALKAPAFWILGVIAMMTFFAILGTTSHVFLRLTGAGHSSEFAARALGLLFMMGLVGKLLSGVFADKVGSRVVMIGSLLLMMLGSLGLSVLAESNVMFWILSFGLGWGSLYTVIQICTVTTFGARQSGCVLGAIAFLEALGGGLGPWIVGLTYDKTGSYEFGFLLITAGLSVAFFLSVMGLRDTHPVFGSRELRVGT